MHPQSGFFGCQDDRQPGNAEKLQPLCGMPHRISKSTVIAACLAAMLGVSAVSGDQPARTTSAAEAILTHLDYVVLASLADSGHWVGLSSYRSDGHSEQD